MKPSADRPGPAGSSSPVGRRQKRLMFMPKCGHALEPAQVPRARVGELQQYPNTPVFSQLPTPPQALLDSGYLVLGIRRTMGPSPLPLVTFPKLSLSISVPPVAHSQSPCKSVLLPQSRKLWGSTPSYAFHVHPLDAFSPVPKPHPCRLPVLSSLGPERS